MFTIYKNEIEHFKLFKKNENSEFISEVLNNFIPMTSKKNEFLIYEGELLEEMLFIKDGRISFQAAINLDDPSISIQKYFYEKFLEFDFEKEKKIYESQLNDNNYRTGFVSMMHSTISYGNAKNKIVKTFKTMKIEQNDNNISILNLTNNTIGKNDEIYNFDVNGGAIKNEDGDYQYLKILDIIKNEHFGIVFMTLNRPCPLSLQVKSKFAELFLLKKSEAINISKSYSNIWKRLYAKEFHNLISIKNQTFKALIKYKEINQLLIDLNLENAIKNYVDITVKDLNELEKSIYTEKKSFGLSNYSTNKQSSCLKKTLLKNTKLNLNESQKLSHIKFSFNHNNSKNLVNKLTIFSDKNKASKFDSNNFSLISSNLPTSLGNRKKCVHFASDTLNNTKIPKKINIINNNNEANDENNKKNNNKLNRNEKLKNLKNFLINIKKKLKLRKDKQLENIKNEELKRQGHINQENLKCNNKGNSFVYKKMNQIKKKMQFNRRNSFTKKINTLNEDITNNNDDDSLIKELNNFCNEESDFSFCSNDKEKLFNNSGLSITKNSSVEILSSYDNINQISKGKYISDSKFQNLIKYNTKKYYSISNSNNDFSLNSQNISSEVEFSFELNNKERKNEKKTNKNINNETIKNEKKINQFLSLNNSSNNNIKKLCKSNKASEKNILEKKFSFDQNKTNKKNNIPNNANENDNNTKIKNDNNKYNKKIHKSNTLINNLKRNEDKNSIKVNESENDKKSNILSIKKNIIKESLNKKNIKEEEFVFKIAKILEKNENLNNVSLDSNNLSNNSYKNNLIKNNQPEKNKITNKKIINIFSGNTVFNSNMVINNKKNNCYNNDNEFNSSIKHIINKNVNEIQKNKNYFCHIY